MNRVVVTCFMCGFHNMKLLHLSIPIYLVLGVYNTLKIQNVNKNDSVQIDSLCFSFFFEYFNYTQVRVIKEVRWTKTLKLIEC
jgi:hypothetical protein